MKKGSRVGSKLSPHEVSRIKRLRIQRGETQAQFAARLGVRQTSVSSWEKGVARPSPESWLGLSMLAPDAEALWFLNRGGYALHKIVMAAERAQGKRTRPASEGELVLIPPIRVPSGPGQTQADGIALPSERVPNPGSTFYIVLSQGTCGDALAEGDILFVDRSESERDPRRLAPFWDELVAVRFAPPPGPQRIEFRDWREGVSVGRLFMIGHLREDRLLNEARLYPLGDRTGARELLLGHSEAALPFGKQGDWIKREMEQRRAAEEMAKQDREKMRAADVFEIVGRVTCILLRGKQG